MTARRLLIAALMATTACSTGTTLVPAVASTTISGNTISTNSGNLTLAPASNVLVFPVTGGCLQVDGSGNVSSIGTNCSTATGTVSSSSGGYLTYYASSGTVVNGLSGVTWSGSALTVSGTTTLSAATINNGLTVNGSSTLSGITGTTLSITSSISGAGGLTIAGTSTLSTITGSAITVAGLAKSSTLQATGLGVSGCMQADSSGNLTSTGSNCSAAIGIVSSSGTGGLITYYAAPGTTVNAVSGMSWSGSALTVSGTTTLSAATINNGLTVNGSSTLSAITGSALTVTGLAKSSTLQATGLGVSGCMQADSSGNLTATGSNCGASGGSGTVSSSTAGYIAYYAANGTVVNGLSAVTWSGSALTITGTTVLSSVSMAGTITAGTVATPAVHLTSYGASGCTQGDSAGNLTTTGAPCGTGIVGSSSSGYFAYYDPGHPSNEVSATSQVYQDGSGNVGFGYAGTTFTRRINVNGTIFASGGAVLAGIASGAGNSCLQIDTAGNLSNTGSTCGSGATSGGSGTVNSGTAGYLAYYATTGAAVSYLPYLFFNSSNNYIGINQTSPAVQLDVGGAINTSGNLTVTGTSVVSSFSAAKAFTSSTGVACAIGYSPSLPTSPTANNTWYVSGIISSPNNTTFSAGVFQGTTQYTYTREFEFNVGLVSNTGNGCVSSFSCDKVALYVGIEGTGTTADIWAINTVMNLDPGGSNNYIAQSYEMDMNNGVADKAGPSDGPSGGPTYRATGLSISGCGPDATSWFPCTQAIQIIGQMGGVSGLNPGFGHLIEFDLSGAKYSNIAHYTSYSPIGEDFAGDGLGHGFSTAAIRMAAVTGNKILWLNSGTTGSAGVSLTATLSATTYTFSLPANAGSAGQCLKTDGSGNTYWGTCSP